MNTPTRLDQILSQPHHNASPHLAIHPHSRTKITRRLPTADPNHLPERPAPFLYRDATPYRTPLQTGLLH